MVKKTHIREPELGVRGRRENFEQGENQDKKSKREMEKRDFLLVEGFVRKTEKKEKRGTLSNVGLKVLETGFE